MIKDAFFMIHCLSKNIAVFLSTKSSLQNKKMDILVYGMEMVLSTLLSMIIAIFLSVMFCTILHGIIFLICFITLRIFTGGFHCSTHLKCYLLFSLICIFCFNITNIIKMLDLPIYILIIWIMVLFIGIWCISPIMNDRESVCFGDTYVLKCRVVLVFLSHTAFFIVLFIVHSDYYLCVLITLNCQSEPQIFSIFLLS